MVGMEVEEVEVELEVEDEAELGMEFDCVGGEFCKIEPKGASTSGYCGCTEEERRRGWKETLSRNADSQREDGGREGDREAMCGYQNMADPTLEGGGSHDR